MSKVKVTQVEKYFRYALDHDLLKFEVSKSDNGKSEWLDVYYKENLSFTPSKDGSKWSLVCAQDTAGYTPVTLCDRITSMLAENLRSARQDANGVIADWKKASSQL